MPLLVAQPDFWSLVDGAPTINPGRLLVAIGRELPSGADLYFRTRLLIRDSLDALGRRCGAGQLERRLPDDLREVVRCVHTENLGEPRFLTLEQRMSDATGRKPSSSSCVSWVRACAHRRGSRSAGQPR